MKLAGIKVPPNTLFLARILDDFNLLLWSFSKNASEGNKPKSIAESLVEKKKDKAIMSFKSGAEFEQYRSEIVKRITSQQKE